MRLNQRFLLYIDFLGFEKMASGQQHEARALFQIIDDLNAHPHEDFQTLVFSDTVLIFNRELVFLDEHKEYLVMFLIEFVADLFYKLAGTGITFRAILVEDDFECVQMEHMTRFFGNALIRAYKTEKDLPIIGLVADRRLRKWNKIYRTTPISDGLDYVLVNQALRDLEEGFYGALPVRDSMLHEMDVIWALARDHAFLCHLRKLLTNSDVRIRKKADTTMDLYREAFPRAIHALESGGWRATAWRRGRRWKEAMARIPEGFRGWGIALPSEDDLIKAIRRAVLLGKWAARKKERTLQTERPGNWWYPCGGCLMFLNVDHASPLGRFLLEAAGRHENWDCEREGPELLIHLKGLHISQSLETCVAGESAALKVLEAALEVQGRIETYVT